MYVELEYLKFKNVLSYGAKEITHSFEPGLTAISGRNGAGKSTFLEVISYNWFGKPYRKIKLEALINRENKKGLETETCICIDHKDHYRIIRNMKPNKLQIFKNNKPFEMLSSKALDQEDITKILGIDYKMFKQIVSLAVTYNKPFLTQEAAEKREIVESIFNIKIIGMMLDVLKKKVASEKVKYTVNKKTVEMLEENITIMRKHIIDVKKSITEFEATKQKDFISVGNNITRIKKELAELDSELVGLIGSITDYENKKANFESLLLKKESELSTISDDVSNPDVVRLTVELKEISDKINSLSIQIQTLENTPAMDYVSDSIRDSLVADRSSVIATGAQLKKEIDLYAEEIVVYHDDPEYSKLEGQLLTPEISDIENLQSAINTIIGDLTIDEKVNKLNVERNELLVKKSNCEMNTNRETEYIDYLKNNDICQKCKGKITTDFRQQEISISSSLINSDTIVIAYLDSQLNENKNTLLALNKLISDMSTLQKHVQKRSDDIHNLLKLREVFIDNEKQKKIAAMRNDLSTLKTKIQTIDISITARTKAMSDEHQKKISDLKIERTSLELSKNIKQTDIDNIKKEKTRIAEKEIDALKSEIDILKINIKNDLDNVDKTKKSIENIKSELLKYDELKKEISERKPTFDLPALEKEFSAKITDFKNAYAENAAMAENLRVYDITSSMLSEEGIKSFFFKRLTPILNAKINEYLDKFDIPVRCKFNEQMEEQIYNIGNENEEVSYYSYSEGEKKSIDTAILMSFIDITKAICNWRCNILLIDELIDGQVDFSRLEKMFDCLREFSGSGMIPSIYIISHRSLDDIQTFFKRIITINKVDGYSELTVKKL